MGTIPGQIKEGMHTNIIKTRHVILTRYRKMHRYKHERHIGISSNNELLYLSFKSGFETLFFKPLVGLIRKTQL